MAKAGCVAVILASLFLVTPGWAAPSNPALMATPPQPKWSELSVPQKIILAPLSDDWDSMENYRQKKWLSIATRFFEMSPEEKRRVQIQMQSWDKLSPEERRAARENFKTASQLPSEQKQQLKQKWDEYSSLPEAEKEKLKQLAETPSGTKPVRPAAPVVTAPLPTPTAPPPTVQNAPTAVENPSAETPQK